MTHLDETDGDLTDRSATPTTHPTHRAGLPHPAGQVGWKATLMPLLLPLFFVIMMSVTYVSALHAPAPHDAPLVLVGSEQVTAPLVAGLEQQAPGAFDTTTTTDVAAAREAVLQRDAIGAIEVATGSDGTPQVTAYTAGGAGLTQAGVVTATASQIATQLGATVTTDDQSPVSPRDSTGTGLFYLVLICTIAGYLSVTVLSQAVPRLPLTRMYGIAAGIAVIAPALAMALMSLFVGGYGASAGQLAAAYGVAVLLTFTVAVVATFITQVLGQVAIFGMLLVLVFLGIPSSGGAATAGVLPAFWQSIHSAWLLSGAMESLRSIIYFDGNQLGRWLPQVAAWTVLAVVGTLTLGRKVAGHRGTTAVTGAEATPAVAA